MIYDVSYLCSGFFAAYFLLITMLKRPSLLKLLSGYYIHRWLRLTPIYMFWLLMYWKVMVYIGRMRRWSGGKEKTRKGVLAAG